MTEMKETFNKHVLLAVDDSENSERAVSYVGRMLGGHGGFKIVLLHVIPEPEADYFPNKSEQERWLTDYRQKITTVLENYRKSLLDCGLHADDIDVQIKLKSCPSLAECILAERAILGYDTIVVGRQGLSRSEEFLFGSVSSKIVTHARQCSVWVVG
jgi:nucleotide-binding universal stress UspA family protein